MNLGPGSRFHVVRSWMGATLSILGIVALPAPSNAMFAKGGTYSGIAAPLAAVTHGKNMRSVWCAFA
jgi:hypothetical protein